MNKATINRSISRAEKIPEAVRQKGQRRREGGAVTLAAGAHEGGRAWGNLGVGF